MKILIWNKNIVLKNTGGPSGYLYNINQYIKDVQLNDIHFYSDYLKPIIPKNYRPKGLISKIYTIIIRFWVNLIKSYSFSGLSQDEIELLNKFDYVHVHSIEDMRKYFLKRSVDLKVKVILTSHCPEPYVDEITSQSYYNKFFQTFQFVRNYFIIKETEAFDAADLIMFPVEQAKEAYTNRSALYEKCFKNNLSKFIYVPTAIVDNQSQKQENYKLNEIYKEKLKVCFVGRHSEIKGYDKLIQIADNVWGKSNEVAFIVGGQILKNSYPKNEKWLELGWVKTSDLLKEIDLFILPNKQTYFDLILLEVLRQGVPVLISATGGNKWFENKSHGIFLYEYDNIVDASDKIIKCLEYKRVGLLPILGKENRALYENELIISRYVEAYLAQLKNIQ